MLRYTTKRKRTEYLNLDQDAPEWKHQSQVAVNPLKNITLVHKTTKILFNFLNMSIDQKCINDVTVSLKTNYQLLSEVLVEKMPDNIKHKY